MNTERVMNNVPSLRWVGAGCPAFVGDAGTGPEGTTRVRDLRDFRSVFGLPESAEVPPKVADFQFAVEGYFLCGGNACVILNIPGFVELDNDVRLETRLVGEDNGPGYRTGLQSLTDHEDIGTVVAPGPQSEAIAECLVEYVRHRSSRALILEGQAGERPPLTIIDREGAHTTAPVEIADRCAWLGGAFALSDGRSVWPAGPVLGALESVESMEVSRAGVPGCAPTTEKVIKRPLWFRGPLARAVDQGVRLLGGRFATLRRWRQWEGMRRSIEMGSRWILYETSDPGLAARVEREVRDFLHGLLNAGLLGGRYGTEAFEVRCRIPDREAEGDVRRKLELTVNVRLRDV